MSNPLVGILMGSDSDWPKIKAAAAALAEFQVSCDVRVMSAHMERVIPVGEFHTGPGATVLAPNEIIVDVEFEAFPNGRASAFRKRPSTSRNSRRKQPFTPPT